MNGFAFEETNLKVVTRMAILSTVHNTSCGRAHIHSIELIVYNARTRFRK
jgi:hypothetical protein